MFNLAFGLAIITMGFLAYVNLPMWFIKIVGIPQLYLAMVGCALLIWVPIFALLRHRKISVPLGRMHWILLFSNFMAISLLVVGSYNSAFPGVHQNTVAGIMDELMNPRLSKAIEFYLQVAYPFVNGSPNHKRDSPNYVSLPVN